MSSLYSRPVTPMSLMTDVFVELERLRRNLEVLRDELVRKPDGDHVELRDARRNCRRIDEGLRMMRQLLGPGKAPEPSAPEPSAPAPEPKGPPNLRVMK
jgi:hypothetical protein